MTRRSPLTLSLLLTTLVIAVAPVQAQIGGLVRRAAKAATTDPKANSESAAPDIKAEDRLTAEALDAFGKGLDAEEGYRRNAEKQATGMKTQAEYNQCMGGMMSWPEYQKIQTGYVDEITKANGKSDVITAAAQNYADKLKAMAASKCGPNPEESQSMASKVQQGAVDAGAKAAGATPARYAMWKERVVPFCNLPASKRGSGVVRAEGYAYLASEAEALAPRCSTLMPKLKQGT